MLLRQPRAIGAKKRIFTVKTKVTSNGLGLNANWGKRLSGRKKGGVQSPRSRESAKK